MTKFLNLFVLLSQLFPAVLTFIRELENAFPQSGQGAAKLQIIREMLEKAFAAVGDVGIKWVEIWPMLNALIERVIALANTLGVFKKPLPAPPAAPVTPDAERH